MNKFNFKRLLSLTLALLMLVSVVACAKTEEETETTANGDVATSVEDGVETDR